jgi:hypothetical protein
MIHPKTEAILRSWNNGEESDNCPGLGEILYRSFGDKHWRHFSQWLFERFPEGEERPQDDGLPYVVDGEPLS